jgi:MFS superfamily sulfate permease-like transporter
LGGSLFRALPSFGGYARSKINALSGAQTQMSSVMLAAITVLSITFLLPSFYHLPKCVLSSVITAVGLSLVEEAPADIKFYWRTSGYSELFTLALTFAGTFFWSVQTGIAVGAGFSLVRVINHATQPRIQILGRVPGTSTYRNVDNFPPDTLDTLQGCLVIKIPEPLIFANTGDLRNRLRRLEYYKSMKIHPSQPRRTDAHELHTVIFDLRGMTRCDAAAIQVLYEIVSGYVGRGICVYFTRMPVKPAVRRLFESSGINKMVLAQSRGHSFFDSIDDALIAAHLEHGDADI